jgi:hypothetical protein
MNLSKGAKVKVQKVEGQQPEFFGRLISCCPEKKLAQVLAQDGTLYVATMDTIILILLDAGELKENYEQTR